MGAKSLQQNPNWWTQEWVLNMVGGLFQLFLNWVVVHSQNGFIIFLDIKPSIH